MLTHIHIKHFVIVDQLNIDFTTGFNVLTGETGAGKSIWVDALMLALGARAESGVVRTGKPQCDITLCFDISQQAGAKKWLNENDFDSDDECIVRRIIKADGKSKSTINGHPCPLSLLRDFSPRVILAHSQHQHLALLKREYQRTQLDQYAGTTTAVDNLRTLYQQWQKVETDINELRQKSPDKESELALLTFQYDELNAVNLQPNEWTELSAQHQKCHQAKSLIHDITTALELTMTDEQVNADSLIQTALTHLNHIDIEDTALDNIRELLNTAAIHLQEAGDSLNQYRHTLDLSPEKLQQLETRIQILHDLARKHHVSPDDLPDMMQSLQQKIHELNHMDDHLNTLLEAQNTLLKKYQAAAQKVTQSRQKTAKKLSLKVTDQIQQLGLTGAQFKVMMTPFSTPINATGQEQVEFHISTNSGEPLQPMSKVVSGGELSRLCLALQMIMAKHTCPPTLIFDEVDVGIGGHTANTVGTMLRELGKDNQILCITHLPQVAAKAHQHFKVSKQTSQGITSSQVTLLTPQDKIKEIARMLGGQSKTSQAHAQQLLNVE